ncbi:MAG: M28 family metallopeptidase [Gemmatimonadaceae bacterium]
MIQSSHLRSLERAALLPVLFLVTACQVATGVAPRGTSPAITSADTRSRIFIVADDSMQGRRAGAVGNYMMTSYIEREVSQLGLEPAGENGTYFQIVLMVNRSVDSVRTSMAVGDRTLMLFSDFAPLRPNMTERYGASLADRDYETVYGGRAGDTTVSIPASVVEGKIVVLDAPLDSVGRPTGTWGTPGALSVSRFPTAAGIAIASLDLVTRVPAAGLRGTTTAVSERDGAAPRPMGFLITAAVAREIMRASSPLRPGAAGGRIRASAAFIDNPLQSPARNVIAVRRGSDPQLRNEYVVIGAHSDHVGISATPVDHDSLRSYNRVMRPEGAQRRGAQPTAPTAAQWSRIRASRDSLRRLGPVRLDSINTGADDDGSGSVALLEIAESLAAGVATKRSIIFIWHTAEENGLLGSAYFTAYPTVQRESIVAALNMDMVGRGSTEDVAGGGQRYLQVIGARRLSSTLGTVLDSVNTARRGPFDIDYSWDAPGHPMSRYCRSDHYMYARRGIPIAYFSRGYHPDYHLVTDEPQYINYDGLARVAEFVRDVAVALADRNDRVGVDKPVPNPLLPCRQ